MDSHYEAQRSQDTAARPNEVYAVVADLHTWPEWITWSKAADPDCTWEFSGESGHGAAMEAS